MALNKHQQNRPFQPGAAVQASVAWNQDSNQRLRLISKNGGIHIGWVEESQVSPAPTQPVQLEIDFNQSTTNK